MAKGKRGVGRPKLSATQKAKNTARLRAIRKAYNALPDKKGITYKQFKNRVTLMQEASKRDTWVGTKNLTVRSAIKKVKQSTLFIPLEQRQIQNLLKGIKEKFPEKYSEILRLCRKKNGQQGSPLNMIKWDGITGYYTLTRDNGDKYAIDIDDSPLNIEIRPVLINGEKAEVPW